MLGQLRDGLLDDLSQMTFPVHVVRTRGRVLELKRTVLILKILLNRLKEHQWIP